MLHSDDATLDVKVRSPYSRVLSAYTDKVVFQHHKLKHNSSKKLLPRGYEMDSGFGPLIDIIAKLVHENPNGTGSESKGLNSHFSPLNQHCWQQDGVNYDIALKVEHMDLWYEPFIKLLGMEESVTTGWNVSTKYHKNSGHLDCFFLKSGCNECTDMFTDRCNRSSAAYGAGSSRLPATMHAAQTIFKGKAVSHGAKLVEERYNKRLADKISVAYAADFKLYQYPLWNGESAYRDKQY